VVFGVSFFFVFFEPGFGTRGMLRAARGRGNAVFFVCSARDRASPVGREHPRCRASSRRCDHAPQDAIAAPPQR
jgi:hypothetical protein